MKTALYGADGYDVMFIVGKDRHVIVNACTLTASIAPADETEKRLWRKPAPEINVDSLSEVAVAAVQAPAQTTDIAVVAAAQENRAYTVPKAVAREAEAGLRASIDSPETRTPTSVRVARMLMESKQVKLADISYINRFFAANTRDAVDQPRWQQWGGDSGQRWAQSITAASLTADGSPEANMLDFYSDDERSFWGLFSPESDELIIALFTPTEQGTWLAWDNGNWADTDEVSPDSERMVELDDDIAFYVASNLFDAPDTPVSLREFDPEEWDVVKAGMAGVDWAMVERAMHPDTLMAAGPPPVPGDHRYTPEERSANAQRQIRDANGKFATVGRAGSMKSGTRATIMKVNPVDGSLIVKDAQGNQYSVPAHDFTMDDPHQPQPQQNPAPTPPDDGTIVPKLNLDGILAEPRAVSTTPKAMLKHLLPPMGPAQIRSVIEDYQKFIDDERKKRAKNFKGPYDGYPVKASGETEFALNEVQNPDTSDVPPIYLALVDRDDPRAVTDLVSLIPKGATGNDVETFRRVGGAWVEDESILQDLRSPTPPPTVKLDEATYKDVLQQVDTASVSDAESGVPESKTQTPAPAPVAPTPVAAGPITSSVYMTDEPVLVWDTSGRLCTLTAAGGLDRNRGEAEKLRHYWTWGEGGTVKIRWGTPGDFDRCVRHLEKYMPGRAKGYCNLRHKDATGEYPATHAKELRGHSAIQAAAFDEGEDFTPPEEIVELMQRAESDPSLLAAGLDRTRADAERLATYWLYGPGRAKVEWDTPGDWRRAHRHLYKYMGPRAAGYASILRKRATDKWAGDRRGRTEFSLTAGGEPISSTTLLRTTYQVLTASADEARALAVKQRVYGMMENISPFTDKLDDINDNRLGRPFRIPLVIPEGLESGDGRTFDRGSLGMRSFPLPLLWQVKTGDGHDGSFLVGRVDRVERTEDGLGNAHGYFDTGPYGQEAQRLVENGMLRWVSADLDRFEGEEVELAEDENDKSLRTPKMRIKKGRLMGITLVPKPAFQECTIELVPMEELQPAGDGLYEGDPVSETEPVVAAAAIAASIPVEPPKVWFQRPILNGPTPLTVTDEGQVFGHIATWTQSHIGRPDVPSAPRSRSGYAYFHTGVVRTSEGDDITVGQLTLAGGHAGPYADMTAAVKHYDDTGSAIADVHVGEDSYGIWAAGAVRPGTTPEQIRVLRASAPSGDWRPVNGALELVAVCQVNVPGFPVARACVASGAIQSLVAAGTADLVTMRHDSLVPTNSVEARIKRLEAAEFARDAQRRDGAVSRVNQLREERREREQELAVTAAGVRERVFKVLDVDGYLSEFKDFSPERRQKLAKDKLAMKDGSFPIENVADLRRAIRAYGRAEESKKGAVRRHIVRRARALGKADLIPSNWSEASSNDLALTATDAKEAVTAAALEIRIEKVKKKMQDPK